MTDAPTTTTDTARATSSTAVQHDGAPSVSVGLLILRLALGITFVMHGWRKFSEWGLGGTAQSVDGMDIPAPEASAVFTAVVELAGGIALILGSLTRITGVLLALAMAGVLVLVHAPAGFFASDGGIELVMVLGAGVLALAFTGPGRYAVARALPSRGGAQAWARCPNGPMTGAVTSDAPPLTRPRYKRGVAMDHAPLGARRRYA